MPVSGLSLLMALAPNVSAGCFREYNTCIDCAQEKAWAAVKSLDLGGFMDAQADAVDCQIDTYHGVILGKHHEYRCSI